MGDRIVVMKDGVIQQVDTPQNLYDFPDNLFVAGFIGSPQMNFVDVVVEKAGSGYQLKYGDFIIPLADQKAVPGIKDYVGKEVVMGIRPEDFLEDPAAGAALEADVDIAELMGAEINLHLNCQGNRLVVRLPSTFRAKVGDRVKLALKPEKIHLFNKETELAICH